MNADADAANAANAANVYLNGDLETIKSLVNSKIDADIAFTYACENGRIDVVEFAISKGADLWVTGFSKACLKGHVDIVKLVFSKYLEEESDEDLIIELLDDGMFDAGKGGHKGVLLFLNSHYGSNYNPSWNAGIMGACEGGHKDIVEFIYSKDYSIHIMQVFSDACRYGHMDIVLFAISKMARFNLTELLLDAYKNENLELVQSMILNNHSDWFTYACLYGHNDIVKSIMSNFKSGLKIGIDNACIEGHKNIVEFFINFYDGNNDDSRYLQNDLNNAFEYACGNGRIDIIELLFSKSNTKWNWNSGLFNACTYNRVEVAKLMISKGANNFNDCLKMNRGYKDIIRLLICNGANGANGANGINVFETDINMYSSVVNRDLVEYVIKFL